MLQKSLVLTSTALYLSVSASASLAGGPGADLRDISEVGWTVDYVECVYDGANDTATYFYDVTVDSTEKDLSHWVLALDDSLTPIGSTGGPTTELGLDPTTGVYGFKWDDGQLAGTTETYSITFNGPCNEGPTDYSVKGGTYYAVGGTTGPSGDGGGPVGSTYSISGVVYLDVNGNGTFDFDEPTLSNTTVSLADAAGDEMAAIYSDNSGAYSFGGLVDGDYSVSVPNATSDAGDFNETLAEYFTALQGVLSVTINGADVTDVNFGFTLNIQDILDDLDENDPDGDGYTFDGTGKTIGYWKHQHSVAIKGRGRAHVDAATLEGYLSTIEGLWLSDPFQFGSNSIQNSFDILSARTSDANELLLKQLLACELNYVDGRGISNNLALQGTILAWAEYMSYYNYMYTRDQLLEMKDLIDTINNSGQ